MRVTNQEIDCYGGTHRAGVAQGVAGRVESSPGSPAVDGRSLCAPTSCRASCVAEAETGVPESPHRTGTARPNAGMNHLQSRSSACVGTARIAPTPKAQTSWQGCAMISKVLLAAAANLPVAGPRLSGRDRGASRPTGSYIDQYATRRCGSSADRFRAGHRGSSPDSSKGRHTGLRRSSDPDAVCRLRRR